MRDGVRLALDIYRPEVEGQKFPALLAFDLWGKDAQEAIGWLADKPQKYYHSPFWDGNMEAMMPTWNVFQKGHSMELITRNQDDPLSRLGTWGVYHLPRFHQKAHSPFNYTL